MKYALFLVLYNLFYPIFLLVSLPGFFIKMRRRGGSVSDIWERLGIFPHGNVHEPSDGIYVHAVSVGEVLIALKWIRTLRKTHSEPVVLATSTATGLQIARSAQSDVQDLRVLYSPVDLPWVVRRCMKRFSPRVVVLIEAELWPNHARICRNMGIPMVILNARLSPRSERRYAKVRSISSALFSHLSKLAVQNARDVERFVGIGVPREIISITGSIKFDVLGDSACTPRQEFRDILRRLAGGKQVVLASSTHPGEEVLIADAARQAGAFPLIVPRHMERRAEVMHELKNAGFSPILRTSAEPLPTSPPENVCYIVDTTGELREWTSLANLVVIGKSFLADGGQNPVEAIAARVPVIVGPHMSNFADLTELLIAQDGILTCSKEELPTTVSYALTQKKESAVRAERGYQALSAHSGATQRSVQIVEKLLMMYDGRWTMYDGSKAGEMA